MGAFGISGIWAIEELGLWQTAFGFRSLDSRGGGGSALVFARVSGFGTGKWEVGGTGHMSNSTTGRICPPLQEPSQVGNSCGLVLFAVKALRFRVEGPSS